ncbi:hypothetical protein LZK35_17675, partial [Pseudomonas aeruginosa]|nr:hypothetical protein [Pseudomonas aeruginosa]
MTREDPIVIVSAVRTPMGGFLSDFKDVNAATLGAAAVRAAVERARLQADEVDEAVLGCVLAAGQGQAPVGFWRVSRHGVPWMTVLLMAVALLLGVALNYLIPQSVFLLIASIATFATVWVWLMILLAQV